jgi:hypothetical protein
MLFWPAQAQPAAASAAAWPPQAMAPMPMQMLAMDPMTRAAYGLHTLTQQTQTAKPKRVDPPKFYPFNFTPPDRSDGPRPRTVFPGF